MKAFYIIAPDFGTLDNYAGMIYALSKYEQLLLLALTVKDSGPLLIFNQTWHKSRPPSSQLGAKEAIIYMEFAFAFLLCQASQEETLSVQLCLHN